MTSIAPTKAESMLCQMLHVQVARDIKMGQSSDWPKRHCVL